MMWSWVSPLLLRFVSGGKSPVGMVETFQRKPPHHPLPACLSLYAQRFGNGFFHSNVGDLTF
ncbi:hypothetical protein [Klebsiella michiganensis]|uniref:hypothetical protein n=1 Tax=Klebsiella michiganensis TaxID=1134687 RepID=UPI0027F0CE3D|nr:hypothetical protein [Klebsiella quasipneumoniae subsp. similipneumoniae]